MSRIICRYTINCKASKAVKALDNRGAGARMFADADRLELDEASFKGTAGDRPSVMGV